MYLVCGLACDLIPVADSESAEVRGLLKVLPSRWLSDQLASLPGYDGSHCGERVTALVTGH